MKRVRLVERVLLTDGAVVHYRVGGDGPPLLLVHGLSGSWRWWRDCLPALAVRRTVHLVDLPGLGRTGHRRLELADVPPLLGAWADALELTALDVVGHSLGGLVSARLAMLRPELVRRLVLVAPAGAPASTTLRAHVLPLAATALRAHPRLFTLVAADAVRAGPMTLWRAARELLADDVRADLAGVRVPTLLVWGERDVLVPPSLAEAFRATLPDARLELLPGAGHVPMVEQPDAFTDAVLAFLHGR